MAAARAPDGGWVTLALEHIAAFDPEGGLRWRVALDRAGKSCGYPSGLAVDRRGRVIVSCGYSLLAYESDGAFRWQVWPGGNEHVTPPLVDARGTIYTGVAGSLYAVDENGKTRWRTSTGWNRWFGAIAKQPDGTLVVWATMYASHSETTEDGYRFYYDHEPAELVVLSRDGKILSRRVHEQDEAWPTWIDVAVTAGGRLD